MAFANLDGSGYLLSPETSLSEINSMPVFIHSHLVYSHLFMTFEILVPPDVTSWSQTNSDIGWSLQRNFCRCKRYIFSPNTVILLCLPVR